jgi:hypothetical protein
MEIRKKAPPRCINGNYNVYAGDVVLNSKEPLVLPDWNFLWRFMRLTSAPTILFWVRIQPMGDAFLDTNHNR